MLPFFITKAIRLSLGLFTHYSPAKSRVTVYDLVTLYQYNQYLGTITDKDFNCNLISLEIFVIKV